MKERKHWKKRAVSLLMALAMVVTQIGVWNAGKESVQAAEEILTNGGFETGDVTGWNFVLPTDTTTGSAINWAHKSGNYALALNNKWVDDSSTTQTMQVTQTIETLAAGDYELSVSLAGQTKEFSNFYVIKNGVKDETPISNTSTAWNDFVTYTIKISESQDISNYVIGFEINVTANSNDNVLIDDISLKKVDEDADADESYSVKITSDVTSVEAGNEVTLTATVKKGNTEITDLKKAGLHLCWWNNTTNSKDEFVDCDTTNWYDLTLKTTLSTIGNNEIQASLQDENWNKLGEPVKVTITVNKAASVVKDAPITVERVSNISSDFIMGVDISSMISELKSGVVYKDYDGKELTTLDDVVKFLAEQGINHIRVRVWNNPYDSNGNGYGGGNNDVAKAKEFADACRKAGINMLVDFHCSDLWTDPGKQQAPKAWKNYTLDQKAEALTTFIKESLNTIDPTKDVVDMVQVGNETTGGFIGETNVANMCTLFSAGSKGVKAYNEDVKVVIHVESPQKGSVTAWAKNLSGNNVNYDIIATSYYPYWHGTLDNLKSEFKKVKETYNKDVMVAETSYAYTLEDSDGHENTVRVGNNDSAADADQPFTEQGQATYIRNLIAAVKDAGGLGVYYWEPAWLTVGDTTGLTGDAYDAQVAENKTKWEKYGSGWASSYASEYDANDAGKWFGGSAVDNQAMFYPDGTATPALHVWNYVKTGSISNLVSVEKIETPSETITQKEEASSYTLPKSVKVTYSNNKDVVAEKVEWNEADKSKVDATKVGTYQIRGTVELSEVITRGAYKGKTTVDVVFTLNVIKANLITNEDVANFTTKAQDSFDISDNTIIKTIEKSENPYDNNGGNCMGWWNGSGQTKTVTITYTDAISLAKGNYVFSLYTQGSSDKVKLQILDTDNNVLFEGNPVELAGWKVWQNPTVSFALDKETNVKLRIEIETQSEGWGSVDVLYLHEDEKSDNGSSTVTPSTPSTSDDADKKDDKNETTTEEKKVTATTPSGETVEATVTVSKDKDGNVTEASAKVAGTKAAISAETAKELAKAAGTDRIAITASVTDKNGNEKYTVTVDSKNLTANKKLHVVAVDPKTGEYKLVNAKTYKVGKDGTLNVKLADGADYKMLTAAELKAVEKSILKTVEVKKPSVTVKNGKKTQIQLSSALDMDNVKSITYKTSKKSVASVSKSGKITTNKKGTATIKAIVTLKNGKKKTVSMTLKVK